MYDYFAEYEELHRVNVIGGKNIAEIAAEENVDHFIHWSTLGVLEEADFDSPNDEEVPYGASNRYCKSKIEQEKALWELHEKKDLPLTVIRPAPIYGPRHRYGVRQIFLVLVHLGGGLIPRIYPRKKQLMFPSVHVRDLIRAAVFIHENKEETIGESYNVSSDPLPQDELLEFLADALGLEGRMRLPIWWPVYKVMGMFSAFLARWLEGRARGKGVRPNVDASMTEYVTHNYWYSNQKIKDLGFDFIYEDPRKGLWDYINWCKERGWL